MNWDDEIPADAEPSPSAADAPLGDMKMMCLDRQVRGHTLQHNYAQETRGKLMVP